jgi:hypothetical protein
MTARTAGRRVKGGTVSGKYKIKQWEINPP